MQLTPGDQSLDAASLTPPSSFDESCIDPRLLRLPSDNYAIASGPVVDWISAPGISLGSPHAILHEVAAGRGSNQPASVGFLKPLRHLRSTGTATCSPLDDPSEKSHPAIADSPLCIHHGDTINPVEHRFNYTIAAEHTGASSTTASSGQRRSSKHKTTFITCCAQYCDQTFFRKDHLTQHIRNKHQAPGTLFHCPLDGCTNHSLSLHDLFEHMKQDSHKGDVQFTSIKNAVEKPKCACGDGLVVSGVCKTCGSRQAGCQ